MFRDITEIVKNILIINVLLFIAKLYFATTGVNLDAILGLHYLESPLFKPHQLVTHMFMHHDFWHLFSNMFGLLIFGSKLEQFWGPKKFLIFYLLTGLGAVALHWGVAFYEFSSIESMLSAHPVDYEAIKVAASMSQETDLRAINTILNEVIEKAAANGGSLDLIQNNIVKIYQQLRIVTVGASGAVFGILGGFAYLFPNTQLFLLFPPIPIKAKYLAIGLMVYELYQGFARAEGDNVAHFAHLGGLLIGFIIIKFWFNKNRKNFY